MERKPV